MRIKKYSIFDIGEDHNYFDSKDEGLDNKKIFEKVSRKSYLPANAVLLNLLNKHPGFKVSFSLSGIFLEQAEKYMPEVVKSFQKLVETGRVEILNETYYHSLAFIYSRDEFGRQVEMHKKKVMDIFGYKPKIFRNTELIYNNDLARAIENLGFDGILLEGADHIKDLKSPNFIHKAKGTNNLKMLLKNYKLSDDIAFRFSQSSWEHHPLTADKFARWITDHNGNGDIINLFMDYETFGEHQWEETGIFEFLKVLPGEILKHPDNRFVTPSEAILRHDHVGELDIEKFMSWADVERDLSAWLSNPMQIDAIKKLYDLEKTILKTGDEELIQDWRRMQTSDHFYYMCTKFFEDGDVHKYFNPYETPYEAFINFMNAIQDLNFRIEEKEKKDGCKKPKNSSDKKKTR